MSLEKMMRRKRKSVSPPDEKASGGSDGQSPESSVREGELVQNGPAMIPQDRLDALKQVKDVFTGGKDGQRGGFSMNELLKMDDQQKGLADILGYPIGAQENDMYRILERCRFKNGHEKQVYIKAIHFAEHGLGYTYKGINLDFPVPFYGEYIVKQLRGSVSIQGESLAVFERTTATWVAKLYAQQNQNALQAQRGIIQ